jgi:tRNA-modifying protein YgfZ
MSNILKDRAIIEISGDDRKKFLQGLLTNDINKASEKNLIYSAMLNSQGRFLYDFFIFEDGEKLVLDCLAVRRDEIIQKLNFYKLRAKAVIAKNDKLLVVQNFFQGQFKDPRHAELGFRTYSQDILQTSENSYHAKRISLKIAESEHDLTYEKSFILEFGFDDLNAIDYQKGCYIGQELTARTHYTGQIRKKLFCLKIDSKIIPEKNSEITCDTKPVGLILSSSLIDSELHTLALIKLPEDQNFDDFSQKLELKNHKIFIVS